MQRPLKNYCLQYFYILSIFIFILIVDCATLTITSAPKNVRENLKLKKIRTFEALEDFYKSFDTVLADVDVLFNGISNVNKTHVKVLKTLEHAGKQIIFYTTALNTIDIDKLDEKLKTFDYTTEFEILNPITAFKWYFEKNYFRGKAYVIGDEDFKAMIKSLNIEVSDDPDAVTLKEYIAGYNAPLDENVKAVIIGFDVNINHHKLTQALSYLKNPEVKLFLTTTKPIFGSNYFDGWVKKMRLENHQPKQYIDRLDGIFGDYLIEKNSLKNMKDKVVCITSNASGDQNFTVANEFKPLLIGSTKTVKNETKEQLIYYYIDQIKRMITCYDDE